MFQASYGIFSDLKELQERAGQVIADRRAFHWDIETGYHGESREKASLHVEENFPTGISFTNSLRWSRYASFAHDTGPNLEEKAVAEILYPLLVESRDDEGRPLGVAHGGKFDLRRTRLWFNDLLGTSLDYHDFRLRSDTMLESYAEAVNRQHGLKELTELQAEADRSGFWHKMLEIDELFEKLTLKQKRCIRFNVLNPLDPDVQRYVCEDTIFGLAHHRMRYPRLQQALADDPSYGPGFIWKLEMAVLPVVCEMEDEGLWYDWVSMREGAARAKAFAGLFMDEIREDFGRLRGEPLSPAFNFGSSQQLARLLYDDCGMPVSHWTKGGKSGVRKPSTDAKVALKGLSGEYPEVAKYLNWKRLTKLERDFLVAFEQKYAFADDGRAHPSLIQHGVPAGRFAHADPNYAQSPKKYHYELRASGAAHQKSEIHSGSGGTGEDVEDAQSRGEDHNAGGVFDFNFRNMIGAPPGWYMLGFDLAQAELRAIAGIAGEERMVRAFEEGVDVHSVTASLIFGVPVDSVTPEQRAVGKTMGLALVYGLTEDGLADRLGITRKDAEDLFAAFHAAYPAIKAWTERTVHSARNAGYVETWWGRRVRIWSYVDSDHARSLSLARAMRREGDRTAGNAPVQGSATGDYMKLAMVRADAALRKAGLKDVARLAMNVHDALEWYVRRDVKPADVIRVLQRAVIFPVRGWPPMAAEWHAGERWGSVIELDVTLNPDGSVAAVRPARRDGKPDETDIDLGDEDEEDVAPVRALPSLDLLQAGGSHREGGEAVLRGPVGGGAAPAVRPAVRPAVAAADLSPRTVVITALHPFPEAAVPDLVDYVRGRPGPNTVRLRLADGQEVQMMGTSGITPADQPDLSVLLGGAVVRYDAASADLAALGAGVIEA